MTDSLQKLEEISLYWVSMDYETIDTIIKNVSDDFGDKISVDQLHNALVTLRTKGLVESYLFSAQHQRYVPQEPIGSYPQTDIWWYVTDKGKHMLLGEIND